MGTLVYTVPLLQLSNPIGHTGFLRGCVTEEAVDMGAYVSGHGCLSFKCGLSSLVGVQLPSSVGAV